MHGWTDLTNTRWTISYPADDVPNCQRFGHNAKQCQDEPRRGKCSGRHPTRSCQSTSPVCVNCTNRNITALRPPPFSYLFSDSGFRRLQLGKRLAEMAMSEISILWTSLKHPGELGNSQIGESLLVSCVRKLKIYSEPKAPVTKEKVEI